MIKLTPYEEIRQIKQDFQKIAEAKGTLAKKEIIKDLEGTVSGRALRDYLDHNMVFHIDKKTIDKGLNLLPLTIYRSIFDLYQYLAKQAGITNQDIVDIQYSIRIMDEDLRDFVKGFLQKSIRLGVSVSTYNSCCPDTAIGTVPCMLAHKYLQHTNAVEGKEFVITLKLDGERCICLKQGETIRFYTRQGKVINGLHHIARELKNVPGDRMFDGELLIKGAFDMPSSDAFKKTMNTVRAKGDKPDVDYHIFDTMTMDEYETRNSRIYDLRREELNRLEVGYFMRASHVKVVKTLYRGEDISVIHDINKIVRDGQQEGVMINLVDQPYQFKRTTALLKVKTFNDVDLEVIDMVEGDGKNAGTLGAMIVNYKGFPVGVGSGFTDSQRKLFWENKEQTVGRVIRVSYFEETKDKNGNPSLRFPTFLAICEDGKSVSYN